MQRGTGTWNVSTTGYCSNPLLGPQQWKVMFYTFPHIVGNEILDKAYAGILRGVRRWKRGVRAG